MCRFAVPRGPLLFGVEYRSDSTSLGNVRRTRQGGIIVPANLTRTGVFVYDYADGTRVRELRHPDEVFKADSLESLAGATVTVLHPGEVTPDNYRQVSVGHVDGTPKAADKFVAADLRVNDGGTIAKIDSKELTEISCGYRCNVIKKSGEWNGEKHDAVQTDIVYNHVAVGPKDWGRAGNDVKIRLDSAGPAWLAPTANTEPVEPLLPGVSTPKLDASGKPVVETAAPAATPAVAASHTDASEALRGQVDLLKAENDRLKADLVKANDPKRLDSLVDARVATNTARVALVASVAPVLGADFKADGKSDHEVRVAALGKLSPSLKLDGKPEAYVSAAFDMAIESATAATAALGALQTVSPSAQAGVRADAARDPVRDAEAEATYRSRNLWRGDSWLTKNPFKPGASA